MRNDPDNPFNPQPLTPRAEEKREVIIQMLYGATMLFMYTIGIAALLYMALQLLLLAEWKNTNHLCLTLQEQAVTFKGQEFYITQSQADRCADYEINAPVK